MSTKKRLQQRVFDSSFTLGSPAAETDHLLSRAYFDNGDYRAIASQNDRRAFVVGRTGSGKSAAFAYLREQEPESVIALNPENLALPYLTNLDVIQRLLGLDVHLEPFFKALWKHVIVVEVLKHRYGINSPEVKRNVLVTLKERFSRDSARTIAIDYLDQFGDRFWCETDERVVQIAETFKEHVAAAGNLEASVEAALGPASIKVGLNRGERGNSHEQAQEIRRELTNRYQRVVNQAQPARLNEMIVILNDAVLDSSQHFTYLLIDDLDKNWVDESLAILLIRCLFDAVMDLAAIKHLKIVIALRSNIFYQLDYGSLRRGYQEEKVRGLLLPIKWTANDLRQLVDQRTRAASVDYGFNPPLALEHVLPNTNRARGDAFDYILGRTLMRPRDVIMYLNSAIREGTGKYKLSWENIRDAEKEYSVQRLQALRDEWKDPYFDIDKAFEPFRGQPCRINRPQLTAILDEIVMVLADPRFRGTVWLTELSEPILHGTYNTWTEMYGGLVKLLYNVSFIGLAKSASEKALYSFQAEALVNGQEIPETSWFEVHPAFRRALRMLDVP